MKLLFILVVLAVISIGLLLYIVKLEAEFWKHEAESKHNQAILDIWHTHEPQRMSASEYLAHQV